MCLWMGTWNALFYSSIANWDVECIVLLICCKLGTWNALYYYLLVPTGEVECIVLGQMGINFVFPVSQPTLKKRADPKIFISKIFFICWFYPKDAFQAHFTADLFPCFKCINWHIPLLCLVLFFSNKKKISSDRPTLFFLSLSKQETQNLFHPALWTWCKPEMQTASPK